MTTYVGKMCVYIGSRFYHSIFACAFHVNRGRHFPLDFRDRQFQHLAKSNTFAPLVEGVLSVILVAIPSIPRGHPPG